MKRCADFFYFNVSDLRQRYGLNENPYPVHRLDKVQYREQLASFFFFFFFFWQSQSSLQGTTGVLVLARSKASARELSRQFRTRAIEKTYLALVRGATDRFPEPGGENLSLIREGLPVIDAPLSFDDGRVRIHRHDGSSSSSSSGSSNLKAARTEWELLASSVSWLGQKARVLRGFAAITDAKIHGHVLGLFVAQLTGRRTVVAGALASTYGVEAPAARTYGTRSRWYVGVRSTCSILYGWPLPCPFSFQCRSLVTPSTRALRLARWSRHARVFQRVDFFCTLRQSPSGCA